MNDGIEIGTYAEEQLALVSAGLKMLGEVLTYHVFPDLAEAKTVEDIAAVAQGYMAWATTGTYTKGTS